MLGSDFEGERANAAAMISKMAKEQKKTIAELVLGGGAPQIVYRDKIVYVDKIVEKVVYRDRVVPNPQAGNTTRNTTVPPGTGRVPPTAGDLIYRLRWVLDVPNLTDFERIFVRDITNRYRYETELSGKQREVAKKIVEKYTHSYKKAWA